MRYTIKIKDRYFHWSTIVDAPITHGMTLDEFREWYKDEYGNAGYDPESFNKMVALLEKYPAVNGAGIIIAETLLDSIRCNRAGNNEEYLTPDQIYENYKEAPCTN